jgi:hypothetical protein
VSEELTANKLLKYKPNVRENIGRPRKRWMDEAETSYEHNP